MASDSGTVFNTAVFDPSGTKVLTAGFNGVGGLYDAGTGERIHAFIGHRARIRSVAFNYNGSQAATASFDSTARIWDVGSGRLLHTLTGHTNDVRAVAFSPNGRYVVTAGADEKSDYLGCPNRRPRTGS